MNKRRDAVDLAAAWRALEAPSTPQTWTAMKVSSRARIARLEDGGAALLVKLEDGELGAERARARTLHVELVPSRPLTIRTGDGDESGRYLVLTCAGVDDALVRQFLRISQILPLDGSADVVAAAAADLFELFRSLSRRTAPSVQGIWAETLLVAKSSDPALLVAAWHSAGTDLHDFVADGAHLEVKSTSRGLREHELSLEQLEHAPEQTTIASLLVEEDPMGATVFDLLDELRPRLPTFEMRRRAEGIVAKALGDGWLDAEEIRFSVAGALETLRLYPAGAIPRPEGPVPATVSGVRFRVDLSGVLARVTMRGPLLESLPVVSGHSR